MGLTTLFSFTTFCTAARIPGLDPPCSFFAQRQSLHEPRLPLIDNTLHNDLVDTPLFTLEKHSLFFDISQCLVCGRSVKPQPFTVYKNQELVAFTVILSSSSLTQFTNNPTLPTQQRFKSRSFEAHSLRSVDTQPLQIGKLVCINPLGAIKNMSGSASAGSQSLFNAGASMSGNASVTSTNSTNLQGISQTVTSGTASPTSLSKSNSVSQSGSTVPTPPPTPVLKGMTKISAVPALSLGQESLSSSSASLVTASPYTMNETTSFPTGTSLWQSTSGQTSTSTTSPTSLVTSSPYDQNESVTFPAGTSLWQSSTTHTAVAASSTLRASACNVSSNAPSSQRPMSAPLPASNVVAASPFTQNECVTFCSQTSLWTSSANTSVSTASQTSPSATSLITSSPYTQNEGVTFPPGTPMWQPKV